MDLSFFILAEEPKQEKPQEPVPVLCPEVWRTEAVDPVRAWAAIVALCRGVA